MGQPPLCGLLVTRTQETIFKTRRTALKIKAMVHSCDGQTDYELVGTSVMPKTRQNPWL